MLSLFWQVCTVVGLVSIVACVALVLVCLWCVVLEPRRFERRRRRETIEQMLSVRDYSPPQRPFRSPRARA